MEKELMEFLRSFDKIEWFNEDLIEIWGMKEEGMLDIEFDWEFIRLIKEKREEYGNIMEDIVYYGIYEGEFKGIGFKIRNNILYVGRIEEIKE